MIPAESAIARVMAETKMDRLQAIRHLQQRAELQRRILKPVYGGMTK